MIGLRLGDGLLIGGAVGHVASVDLDRTTGVTTSCQQVKGLFCALTLLAATVVAAPAGAAALPNAPSAAICNGSAVGPGIAPPTRVPLGIPGFHASWYGQSGYPTLCPGERSSAVVAFYNSGSRGWVNGRMGEVAYLGTWNGDPGQDEPTVLGGNGEMGSPQTGWPRFNRVATQPSDYVGPGQVAWFQFAIQAPDRPGFYRLYIRPLVEGATWMEDAGVYWQVTVLNADGTPPAGRVSSRVPAPIEDTAPPWAPAQLDNVALVQSTETGIALVGGTRGSWTSTWMQTRFPFSQLIPSWSADTPAGSWIEVEVQARTAAGRETRWWRMGIWAYGDETIRRTSVNGQSDADGVVETDTFKTQAEKMTAYRARVTLSRSAAAAASPTLRRISAVVSDTRSYTPRYPSPRYSDRAMELAVGGGEAWCSPTSTEMVVEFWNKRPTSGELSWVGPHSDPQVDYAARFTFDAAYGGTGNWPFNTAYASRFGLSARVLQLGSLNDAERYILAGVPLVASISHARGALPGFLNNDGTNGHLLVIVGFTASGDVIANDPAATSDATVRRVYGREAFERAWIGGSGGVVYFIAAPNTFVP